MRYFKQLLNNKGSVIFVTVLFAVAILLGTSMLFLVAQVHEDRLTDTEAIFNRYTYESYGAIMANELVADISESTASMQYTPLLTDEEILGKIQSALHKEYVDSKGIWIYDNLLPNTVTSTKVNAVACIETFPSITSITDLRKDQSLRLSDLTGKISFSNLDYYFTLSGLQLNCSFASNKVICSFDTSNVIITMDRVLLR